MLEEVKVHERSRRLTPPSHLLQLRAGAAPSGAAAAYTLEKGTASVSASALRGRLRCLQMPEEERGHKQLGRLAALSHLMQLGLTLLLGILVMAEPWASTFAWRSVYGGFGVVYALQVCSVHAPLAQSNSRMGSLVLGKLSPSIFSAHHVWWLWYDVCPPGVLNIFSLVVVHLCGLLCHSHSWLTISPWSSQSFTFHVLFRCAACFIMMCCLYVRAVPHCSVEAIGSNLRGATSTHNSKSKPGLLAIMHGDTSLYTFVTTIVLRHPQRGSCIWQGSVYCPGAGIKAHYGSHG